MVSCKVLYWNKNSIVYLNYGVNSFLRGDPAYSSRVHHDNIFELDFK